MTILWCTNLICGQLVDISLVLKLMPTIWCPIKMSIFRFSYRLNSFRFWSLAFTLLLILWRFLHWADYGSSDFTDAYRSFFLRTPAQRTPRNRRFGINCIFCGQKLCHGRPLVTWSHPHPVQNHRETAVCRILCHTEAFLLLFLGIEHQQYTEHGWFLLKSLS